MPIRHRGEPYFDLPHGHFPSARSRRVDRANVERILANIDAHRGNGSCVGHGGAPLTLAPSEHHSPVGRSTPGHSIRGLESRLAVKIAAVMPVNMLSTAQNFGGVSDPACLGRP